MNKLNFTKAAINGLPASASSRDVYHDTKTNGLQLRVSANGTKTFSVFRRIKNGNPERVTLGRHPDMTVEQARRKAVEITSLILNGKSPADRIRSEKKEMTLDDLFREYMERRASFSKRPDKPAATYRLYLAKWGKRKLSSIHHDEVDRLHKKIGREIGKVTANIMLKLLHTMFNRAINEWRIWAGENPAHGIKKFPEQSRDRFLHADEMPRFFQSVMAEENETIRDFILIALLTGARRSNVLAMRWQDINFERAEWRIHETKNGTPQTVTLSPEAIEILTNRKLSNGSVFVFPGAGKSGHLMEPKKGWQRILKRAGIEDLHVHDLRRTLGSWQAKTGASLVIIGKSLNHKSQNTTAIYARLDADPVRASVNKATEEILTAAGMRQK